MTEGWSTRELAELAGTTVNTVRHYHRTGLLEQPERRANGYKRYGVPHLVRLLQIRRLRQLGVPLAAIEALGGPDGDASGADALRAVDAELAASIDRLQRAREEIAAVLRSGSPADVPAGFEGVAAGMSPSDRSLVLIYSQLYDEAAMADLRDMVAEDASQADAELDALPPDADEETRRRLAETLSVAIEDSMRTYAWVSEPGEHLRRSEQETGATIVRAVAALYNEAQRDVLARASALAAERVRGRGPTRPPDPDR